MGYIPETIKLEQVGRHMARLTLGPCTMTVDDVLSQHTVSINLTLDEVRDLRNALHQILLASDLWRP